MGIGPALYLYIVGAGVTWLAALGVVMPAQSISHDEETPVALFCAILWPAAMPVLLAILGAKVALVASRSFASGARVMLRLATPDKKPELPKARVVK